MDLNQTFQNIQKHLNRDNIFGLVDEHTIVYIPDIYNLCLISKDIQIENYAIIDIRIFLQAADLTILPFVNPIYGHFYQELKNNYGGKNDILIKIIKFSLSIKDNYDNFKKQIEPNERTAAMELLDRIHKNKEGLISLVKIARETNVHRKYYSSVLEKMNNLQLVELQNCGVKGTYIKVINNELWRLIE